MNKFNRLDKVTISVKSRKIIKLILDENPLLKKILLNSQTHVKVKKSIKMWMIDYLNKRPEAYSYYSGEKQGLETYSKLSWEDFAAIRILDYIDNSGKDYSDLNLRGEEVINDPFKILWFGAKKGTGGGNPDFFEDMLYLFRQLNGKLEKNIPSKDTVNNWMDSYPAGTEKRVVKLRKENKDRIINVFIDKIDKGEIKSEKYKFTTEKSKEDKVNTMLKWWDDYNFHLSFAVRSPDLLNELLDYSIDPDTMDVMYEAEKAGIPFFVNPYYLSLLSVKVPDFAVGADLGIRDYILYSEELVNEFGNIVAWEKEDKVKPGKPNAAGWILPTSSNVHRRYPEVAILIPETKGRACGGLCSSCQRMYDFQSGNLNFNLDELSPSKDWPSNLKKTMKYWEEDSQLRDILITGGDALMNSNKSLELILTNVLEMAKRKKKNNKIIRDGKKKAEIVRVRLGTRLLAYLPQRVNSDLIDILKDFKAKASKVGIKQFVIQTHFESTMEITPEAERAVNLLLEAGWMITNQHVFSAAASRRGHAAKLRKELNKIGVMPYYTFTVKGYKENSYNFATNARAVQEQIEEKRHGKLSSSQAEQLSELLKNPEKLKNNLNKYLQSNSIPFIASGRNVLNLPGVGKSLTYRVIGITRYGRRILEFDHDHTRSHSPIIDKMGKVVVIESKSIGEYLRQLEEMGENPQEYSTIWGYSIGETEKLLSVYEYPEYDFKLTEEITNIEV